MNQIIEKELGKTETEFSEVYGKLIAAANLNVLTPEDRKVFSKYIAVQDLRTLETRLRIEDMISGIQNAITHRFRKAFSGKAIEGFVKSSKKAGEPENLKVTFPL